MTKSERSSDLKGRLQAIAIIKNIRRVKRILAEKPFTDKLYNKLNGSEGGMDALVGRTVLFGSLNENDRLELRREINNKLDAAEREAIESLRAHTNSYLSGVQAIIDKASAIDVTDKTLTDISSTRETAVEAFNNFTIEAGGLDCERCMSTLEHLDMIAESIDESAAEIETELQKEEDESDDEDKDKHDEFDEDHIDEEDEDEDDEDDHIPDDPLEEDDDDDDEDDGECHCDDDDEPVTDVSWVKAEESFRDSAKLFMTNENTTSKSAGFSTENAKEVLAAYHQVNAHYIKSLKNLIDTVAAPEATVDQLLRGGLATYRRIDKIVDCVESLEFLRDALDKSCGNLVAASKKMLVESTRDPLL